MWGGDNCLSGKRGETRRRRSLAQGGKREVCAAGVSPASRPCSRAGGHVPRAAGEAAPVREDDERQVLGPRRRAAIHQTGALTRKLEEEKEIVSVSDT